jgi:hypothetical protein
MRGEFVCDAGGGKTEHTAFWQGIQAGALLLGLWCWRHVLGRCNCSTSASCRVATDTKSAQNVVSKERVSSANIFPAHGAASDVVLNETSYKGWCSMWLSIQITKGTRRTCINDVRA